MKIKKGHIYELDIVEMAFGGKGMAKMTTDNGEWVVFVPNTIPGQKIECRLTKKRTRHGEARLMKVLEKSPLEIDLPYQEVSGAPFAKLPLEKQRFYKKRDSLIQFQKLAQIQDMDQRFDEYIESPQDWFYRNKMEYSFSFIVWSEEEQKGIDGFSLGFKRRGMWWCTEDLNKPSGLFDEEFESKLKDIRIYCEKTGLQAWHAPGSHGFFRNLMVRKSFKENTFMISLQTTSDGLDKFSLPDFADFMEELFPGRISGVLHTLNDSQGDRFNYDPSGSTVISGKDHFMEELLGLKFTVSLSSFFQTNPASAERLYQKVIDYTLEYGKEGIVMDLFCGTGTIAQLVARQWTEGKVIGVDLVESAIEDAKKNAKYNGIDNVEFYAADVGNFLNEHPEFAGQISSVILDPPRSGITTKALKRTIELGADTIVYVSCNPSTQARDTAQLMSGGYELKIYSLVDQFPHTSHIEGIAVFTKQN
jgi:23S rRNA (uracil-5-)-methyltransferase RumA